MDLKCYPPFNLKICLKNETDVCFYLSTQLRNIIKHNVSGNLLPKLRTYVGPNPTAQRLQVERLLQDLEVTKATPTAYWPQSFR